MVRTVFAFITVVMAAWLSGMAPAIAHSDDAPAAVGYITGLQNPEDLLQIGHGPWIIASGLKSWTNPADSHGHIYLVDTRNNAFEVLFPGNRPVFNADRQMFPDCPGPLNIENFSAHGLALKAMAPGRFRLYMTGHGEREAIEAFDVDARGPKPTLAWVGCVPLPAKTWGNSVAILNDGGFLVTKSKDSTDPAAFRHLVEQRITGEVFEWHPGGSVKIVAGTQASCPNGIAVSDDDRWIYVSAMGTHQLIRYDRKAPVLHGEAVSIPIYPDNVHWADDGMLYVMGRNYVPRPDGTSCPLLNCGTGWSVVKVNPRTLAVERMAGADQTVPLQAPSAVIVVDDRYWIGNFDGDRLGYIRKPIDH